MANHPLSDFRRLSGLSDSFSGKTLAEIRESNGHKPKQLAESVIEDEEKANKKKYGVEDLDPLFDEQRRLLGKAPDQSYRSWTHAGSLSEGTISEGVNGSKIRRMAAMFEGERMGGGHLPEFEWDRIEALHEAVAAGNIHPDVAKRHIKAVQASKVAHHDNHKTHEIAHTAHMNAAQLHHDAAHALAQAGDSVTAAHHKAWAANHEKHAKAHAGVAAGPVKGHVHTAEPAKKGYEVHADPFGSKKAAKAPKKDAAVAPKDATVHWRPGQAEHPAPTKPKKVDDSPKKAEAPKDHPHTQAAHNLSYAAASMGKDKSVSHKELSSTHDKASKGHLKAMLHHFLTGDHERAQTHFDAAVHHANSAKGNRDLGTAQKKKPAQHSVRASRGYSASAR